MYNLIEGLGSRFWVYGFGFLVLGFWAQTEPHVCCAVVDGVGIMGTAVA